MLSNCFTRKAVIEAHGSSGWEVVEQLRHLAEQRFGGWAPAWRVIIAETLRSRPIGLPAGWHFEPVGEPLSRLYPRRATLGLPEHYLSLPQEVWVDTFDGAQKLPAAAAICYALHAVQLNAARQAALDYLRSAECLSDTREFTKSKCVQMDSHSPTVVLCASAGGSTGHAGILNALDHWLAHDHRPRIMIVIIGPECGVSEDDHRTERANALRLLASIQLRAGRGDQVWPFILDGTPRERKRVLEESARFMWSLLAESADANLVRQLVNGFGIATRVEGGRLPRIWCEIDAYREAIDARHLLQLEAHRALEEALLREVLAGNDARI
jgi:hypothetical protein